MKAKIGSERVASRARRRLRIRKKVAGTAERPRFAVFRSLKHTYVQVIDDANGQTLAAASSNEPSLTPEGEATKKADAARLVGELAAKRCLEKGISAVVFDRGGYPYHGRVSAVATGARDGGLNF